MSSITNFGSSKVLSTVPSLPASYLLTHPNDFNHSLPDVLILYQNPSTNRQQHMKQIIAQVNKELNSDDQLLQAQAAYKLVFLLNQGIDLSFASVAILKLMCSTKTLQIKRLCYSCLAPSLLSGDLVMLATSNLQRDLCNVGT
jgi:hypothetical protein